MVAGTISFGLGAVALAAFLFAHQPHALACGIVGVVVGGALEWRRRKAPPPGSY